LINYLIHIPELNRGKRSWCSGYIPRKGRHRRSTGARCRLGYRIKFTMSVPLSWRANVEIKYSDPSATKLSHPKEA